MQEISFGSRIVPLDTNEFTKVISKIGRNNSVNYPWTIKESILAKDTYTKNICDCTACLITDGNKSLLLHLCPTIEQNHAISLIIEFLRNTIDLKNKNLQAVLIGSKNTKKSLDIYEKLTQILKRFNIPFSEFKNSKTPTHIAYRTDTDEVYITNNEINKLIKRGNNPQTSIEKAFEKISVSNCDDLSI